MAQSPQGFANHRRLDPLFHFFVLPVFGISLILTILLAVRHPDFRSWWAAIFAAAAVVAIIKMRTYATKVQDRVIRLEERLRLAALLPDPLRARIPALTERQLIALRFAPDEEIPGLVERTLAANLDLPDIKKAIHGWRPDYWRV